MSYPEPNGEQDTPECDVRGLSHGLRRSIVWAAATGLRPGQAFILVNDHDPVPIRSLLDTSFPGAFRWTYVEHGPQAWLVRVERVDPPG